MKKTSFKIFGYLIIRRSNGFFYICLSRDKHKSLKTDDEQVARTRARALVQEIVSREIISMEKKDNPTIKEYFEDYLDSRRDLAKDTIDMDRTAVKMFCLVVGNKKLRELTAKDGMKFKNHYLNLDRSKETIRSYFRHLNVFFNYAIKDPGVDFNRNPLPENVKKGKRLPKVIKKKARKIILKWFKINNIEMWRIVWFDLHTGCRRTEIRNADWENFTTNIGRKKNDKVVGKLVVTGKGDKQRTIPIVKEAFFAMGPMRAKGRIFVQHHPDTYTHNFKKGARACGFENINFHMLRHSAATQMIENGFNIRVVQQILGHADISTTLLYTEVFNETMMKEMEKLNY